MTGIPALRQALRLLRQRPAFTGFVIATLALGIGGATAMFSVLHAVLWRPLPYPAADRVMTVWQTFPHWRDSEILADFWDRVALSWDDYQAIKKQARTLEQVEVYYAAPLRVFRAGVRPEQMGVAKASAGFLTMLGGRPALGRWLRPDEEGAKAPAVALLSYQDWLARWNGDPGVLGQTVRLNTTLYEIIGVMPRDFAVRSLHPRGERAAPALWIPIGTDQSDFQAFSQNYEAIARLPVGMSAEQSAHELFGLLQRHRSAEQFGVRLLPRLEAETRTVRAPLVLLALAVGLLLLLTCANVCALQLGEAMARQGEMKTRAALGASAPRLIRQLLAENLVLAGTAAIAGILIGQLGTRLLLGLAPEALPRLNEIGLNPLVLVFAIGITVLVVLGVGLAPALSAARSARLSGGSTARVTRPVRFEYVLLAAQMTLSMVLLGSASLLARSLNAQANMEPGFAADRLLAVRVRAGGRPTNEQHNALLDEQLRRIRALPGVSAASASTAMPFREPANSWSIELNPEAKFTSASPSALRLSVASDYFETMNIPMRAGRALQASDFVGETRSAVVNRAFVQRFWPGQDVLGRRFRTPAGVFSIVGVAEDTRMEGLEIAAEATFFLPQAHSTSTRLTFLVRTRGEATAVSNLVRESLAELDPELAVIETNTVTGLIHESLADERYRTTLLSGFALLAALIAAVGLAGSTLRAFERRRRELCIRLSIGATPASATGTLLGNAGLAVGAGLVLGLLCQWPASRLLRAQLFGITSMDPVALLLGAAVLIAAATAALAAPARRLWRTDIARVLREL